MGILCIILYLFNPIVFLLGTLEGVRKSVIAASEHALNNINILNHDGGHPRKGAVVLNLSRLVESCLNLAEILPTLSKLFKLLQTCLKLSKLVQTCHKLLQNGTF